MSTNKITAYHLVTKVEGKAVALFTINRLELNLAMFEYIQNNSEVLFHLKTFQTTKEQFLIDLQKLTSEVSKNGTV